MKILVSTYRGLLMKKVILKINPLWKDIADDSPKSLNNRSVNANSYATGVIGELAVSEALASLGIDHSHDDTYEYDFLADGVKIDVKTNNYQYGPISYNNKAMLTEYLKNQKCDVYVFVVTSDDEDIAQIMGCCAKHWFWSNDYGVDYKSGEIITKRPIKQSARLMKYKHLTSFYGLPLLLEALK